MKVIWLVIVSVFLAIIGPLVFLVVHLTHSEQAPVLFPLDDESGRYRIQMLARNYAISYRVKDSSNDNVVLIGTSTPALAPYVGKRVRVTGHFQQYATNRQCIAGDCHLLFDDPRNHAVVADIATIEEDRR